MPNILVYHFGENFKILIVQMIFTDYLNKNSKGNLFILKHYLYSVSNVRPLGLCQETNIWIYVVNYISISQPKPFVQNSTGPCTPDFKKVGKSLCGYSKERTDILRRNEIILLSKQNNNLY